MFYVYFFLFIFFKRHSQFADCKRVGPLPINKHNVPYHIEISQLIYIASQLTGFYMTGNIGRWWVKPLTIFAKKVLLWCLEKIMNRPLHNNFHLLKNGLVCSLYLIYVPRVLIYSICNYHSNNSPLGIY